MSAMGRLCLGTLAATIAAASTLVARGALESDDPSPVIVTLSEMTICCDACGSAIASAAQVGGVQVQILEVQRAVVLTAEGYDDVQRSLNALAEAGFYGQIEDDTQAGRVQFPQIETGDEKVRQLSISHIYNGCSCCTEAINAAINSVDGVASTTVRPNQVEFVVNGNFYPGEVVQALEDAGFYPRVE